MSETVEPQCAGPSDRQPASELASADTRVGPLDEGTGSETVEIVSDVGSESDDGDSDSDSVPDIVDTGVELEQSDMIGLYGDSSAESLLADDEHDEEAGTAEAELSDFERAWKAVPYIGKGNRWYDMPYRLLSWFTDSWRWKLSPVPVRRFFIRAQSFLSVHNHLARLREETNREDLELILPRDDEHVTLGSTWIIELFPPSKAADLLRGLKRAGWELDRVYAGWGTTNSEKVTKSRGGGGWRWWRLADVVAKNSTRYVPGATRESLPTGFEHVDLRAVQLGSSLTAVVARFERTREGARKLDETWRLKPEPQIEWHGMRQPQVHSRYFAAIRNTQQERQRQHDAARKWLASKVPGYFAENSPAPALDLCLFEQYDPVVNQREGRLIQPDLEALGLDGHPGFRLTSPQIPHMALIPHKGSDGHATKPLDDSWAIVANRIRANIAYADDRRGFEGSTDAQFYSHKVQDFALEFLLMLAVYEYQQVAARKLAGLRDEAQKHQGRFSVRKVKHLQTDLIERSLELTWVGRDTKRLWRTGALGYHAIKVHAADLYASERNGDRSFNYTRLWRRRLRVGFRTLVKEDARYRDVLSSAVSLGSAVQATRLSRWALLVSIMSLSVVILTLLMMDAGENSLWNAVLERWLSP